MENNSYLKIKEHYQNCFTKYGETPKGLDWDNEHNMRIRYRVMYELIKPNLYEPSILDFGCGYAGFYNYLTKGRNLENNKHFKYTGLDINEEIILKNREKYPAIPFAYYDIHNPETEYYWNEEWLFPKSYDYIIANGTFTVKHTLTQKEMWNFMKSTLKKLWEKTDKGLSFNCMSKILDYERDDLFHVSFDELGSFIYSELQCSKFKFRQDYGLREFCTYLYK